MKLQKSLIKAALTVVLAAVSIASVAQQRPAMQKPEQLVFSYSSQGVDYNTQSSNMAPTVLIYPDTKLTEDSAKAFFEETGLAKYLDYFKGSAMIVNPVGAKYDNAADHEAFVKMFDAMLGWSCNLKVVGIGAGATFVNSAIAPDAGMIAGIATYGGKAGKAVKGASVVPFFAAGKNADKIAKPYIAQNSAVAVSSEGGIAKYANADEPLAQVVVKNSDYPSIDGFFKDAWNLLFSKNYRYNNIDHTWYNGAKYHQYGEYELEPYVNLEALGIERNVVTQKQSGSNDWLWYEYFPKGVLDAPEHSVPLMVLLHGNTNDPRTQAETSGFVELAVEERFAVIELEWQGSKDWGAMGHDGIEQTVYAVLEKYPQLDPSRVYAEGLSAGSMTATQLGVKKSHLFTAVGGHSGGVFGGPTGLFGSNYNSLMAQARQKRGHTAVPYFSIGGTKDQVVIYPTAENYVGNGYVNAWNIYETMNNCKVVTELNFDKYPVFGFELGNRQSVSTNKGITVETGDVCDAAGTPMIRCVAVVGYGHWNFKPTAKMMWDYFMMFSRNPENGELIYHGK